MPQNNRPDEEFEFDDTDAFGDEEFEDYDDDEEYDDEGDDEGNDIDQDVLNKYIEKARDIVIEELSKGDDPNSPYYKGMQKSMAKKDKQINELRTTLAQLSQYVQSQGVGTNNAVGFIIEQMGDMLNEEGKQMLYDRLNQRSQKSQMEQMAIYLQQLQNQNRGSMYSDDENEQLAQYRKEALDSLKDMVKIAGVDPNDPDVNYGDDDEPLAYRIKKMKQSLEKIKERDDDDTIGRVRRKVTPPNTRTSASQGSRNRAPVGRNLVDEGMSQMAASMKKAMKGR